MKNVLKHNKTMLAALGSVLSLALSASDAQAAGMIQSLSNVDINESSLLKNNGFVVGGWANAGVTYNAEDPKDKFNGPVTFGDRDSEFQLNQLNLFIQRAVATEGDKVSIGGRFDIMFGTDSIFTQAYGVPSFDVNSGKPLTRSDWDLNMLNDNSNRFYDLALPQAYLEAYLPIGNGLNIKAGHFYTPIGFETVPAPDNFFYSHAYTMQYGEPFTHTGFLGNYAVNSNWSFMAGAITGSATGGWDGGWDKQLGNWAGIGGATWTSTDKGTSANITGTYGDTSEKSDAAWSMYSIVLKHNITDKFHMMLQHDHGFADKVLLGGVNKDAEWYGINTHFYYDVKDNLTVGIRGEWFRDPNGFRVCSPGRVSAATDNSGVSYAAAGNYLSSCAPATYYEVTFGLNWKPLPWLNIRPNVRYDWVNAGGYTPFKTNKGVGSQTDQVIFSTDMNINF
jgi:hypothetical protein